MEWEDITRRKERRYNREEVYIKRKVLRRIEKDIEANKKSDLAYAKRFSKNHPGLDAVDCKLDFLHKGKIVGTVFLTQDMETIEADNPDMDRQCAIALAVIRAARTEFPKMIVHYSKVKAVLWINGYECPVTPTGRIKDDGYMAYKMDHPIVGSVPERSDYRWVRRCAIIHDERYFIPDKQSFQNVYKTLFLMTQTGKDLTCKAELVPFRCRTIDNEEPTENSMCLPVHEGRQTYIGREWHDLNPNISFRDGSGYISSTAIRRDSFWDLKYTYLAEITKPDGTKIQWNSEELEVVGEPFPVEVDPKLAIRPEVPKEMMDLLEYNEKVLKEALFRKTRELIAKGSLHLNEGVYLNGRDIPFLNEDVMKKTR